MRPRCVLWREEGPSLLWQALGLLVRHFEQRNVLARLGGQVQLLVKPSMITMYQTFDDLLKQLDRLARRRRLFDEELYRAARLMGQLLSMRVIVRSVFAARSSSPRSWARFARSAATSPFFLFV